MSQQLATLQRSTPVALTRKQGRTLVLTDAGLRLADAAQQMLNASAQVEQVMRSLSEEDRDPVHVAAFHSAGQAWFPGLIADPDLDVRCHDHDVPGSGFVALAGDVDIVIAHRTAHEHAWPPGLRVVPLVTEPLDIALRTGHPAADAPLTPDVLAELSWIAVHDDFPLAGYIDAVALHAGRPLRVLYRINEFPTTIALLAASDCAALLPRHTIPETHGAIELHAVDGLRLERHVEALVRPERLARPAVRATLTRLRELATSTSSR